MPPSATGLMHEPWFKEKSESNGWTLRGSVAGGMALVPVIGERWEAVISHHKSALGYRADLRVVNRTRALHDQRRQITARALNGQSWEVAGGWDVESS